MPPKKSSTTKAGAKREQTKDTKQQKPVPQQQPSSDQQETKPSTNNAPTTNGTSAKRKSPPESSTSSKPSKGPRRAGSRASSRKNPVASAPTPGQLLNFLLSPQALPYCYPADELSASTPKTYSRTAPTHFTPFQHLLTASLLSKPLSHKLGMRATRTLLNPPFDLDTPAKIVGDDPNEKVQIPKGQIAAGEKRVWDALEAARTQHRQKTASYLYQMARTFDGADGQKTLEGLQHITTTEGFPGVQKWIKTNIKGMATTGAEIFCRRVQCCPHGWADGVWPYIDSRGVHALQNLGLEVADGEELQDLIERCVDFDELTKNGMGLDATPKEMEMDQQVAVEFVLVVERAIGAGLEGKVDEVRREAAKI